MRAIDTGSTSGRLASDAHPAFATRMVAVPDQRGQDVADQHDKREGRRGSVVIADGDPLARRVLRDEFQGSAAFAVAAEAGDGIEAVELAKHYHPDVLLLEVALNRLDGIAATRRVVAEAPGVHVLLFATRCDEGTQFAALRAGASGFLSKEEPVSRAVEAVGHLVDGEAAVSSAMTMALLRRLQAIPRAGRGMRPVSSPLTTREWQVLDLLSAGLGAGEIAARLGLTEDTVGSHIKHMMRKLGARNRAGLIAAANRLCRQHAVAS